MLSSARPSHSILRALSRTNRGRIIPVRTVLSHKGLSKSLYPDLICSSQINCSLFSRSVSNTTFTPLSSASAAAAAASTSAPSTADAPSLVTTVAPPRPGIAVPAEWGEIEGYFDKHQLQPHIPAMSMPALEAPVEDVPLDSIIKVFAVVSPPNYIQPWQNKPLKEVTGSGFAIKGRRVLTNAHVVADQKYVMVKRQGSAIKFHAQVEAVGHECDLAVLTIKDERFWDGMEELEFADIPNLQEQVTVVGYPIGGDNLSVTKGVVSRVEPQQYAHGASKLLAIQIDAAINPGNSGGPAVQGRKVVGVAFQNLQGAENIGFIIPVPIIKHFLTDIERHKAYVGFCELGIMCQTLENPYFQKVMNLSSQESSTGIVVNFVAKVSPAYGVLKKFDVITAVDGHPIACDGSVHFRGRERIPFDYLLSHKYAGDPCHLDIVRNGVSMQVVVNMQPVNHLVPVFQYDTMPSFLIYAGLVFVPLTQPYLHEYGYDWYDRSPRRLCHLAMNGKRKYPDQQVVILSQVLIDDVNVGYQRAIDSVITRVNGIEVRNLKHLREILDQISAQTTVDQMAPSASSSISTTSVSASAATEAPSAHMRAMHTASDGSAPSKASEDSDIDIAVRVPGTVVFETDDHRLIVIDAAAAKASESALLERHRIPASRSPDLTN